MAARYTPMLLAAGRRLPAGDTHVLQPKHDGVRVLVTRIDTGLRWVSRHGTDLSGLAPSADADLKALPVGSVIDGELICLAAGPGGAPVHDFAAVRSTVFTRRPSAALALAAFDVLADRGRDVTSLHWDDRDGLLRTLIGDGGPALTRCPALEPTDDVLEHLATTGWEGGVAKAKSRPYRPGARCSSWTKFKARRTLRGEVLALGDPDQRGSPRALVRDETGRRSWCLAWSALNPGEVVNVAFSRYDADGTLRDARVSGSTA